MSTPCDDALRQLYRYLDGALTNDRRSLIASHIDECSHCLDVFDFESDLRRVIAQRCREEVPDELRVRILQVIQQTTIIETEGPAQPT